MPNLTDGAVLEQDFNDVEADFDSRIFEQAQVIERSLGKQPLFRGIDRGGRTIPILGRTRFDFDENQAILVAENEVDFPAARSKIGREISEPRFFEIFKRGLFAEAAMPQMQGSFLPPQT